MKLKEFLSIGLMLLLSKECFAASSMKAPVKTNKNEITIEFNDNIENRASLDLEISEQRNAATSSIGSGAVMEVLALNEGAVSDLKSIDANSLEGNGREARSLPDNTYFNDFETDYTKPGSAAHNTDADEIVTATEKSLQGLTEFLRKNGIDCNEVSKSAEVVDPYYIEIERSEHKEVDYDLKFCEYPRNTYNCQDSMTMRCEKKGWSVPWEPGESEFRFSQGDVTGRGWSDSVHWKRKRHGIIFKASGDQIRTEIAKRLNVSIDQIHPSIRINGRGNGEPYIEVWPQFFAWETYSAFYKFRAGEEICEQWSKETWSESCGLK